jgi:hypothetical protein
VIPPPSDQQLTRGAAQLTSIFGGNFFSTGIKSATGQLFYCFLKKYLRSKQVLVV